MKVSEAITGRQSIRAFDANREVSKALIAEILTTAGRAPSGSNIQPWQVYVLMGSAKQRMVNACVERFRAGDEGAYEYAYYPKAWRQPYIGRRRTTGFGLYGLLGIDKADAEAVQAYRVTNYQFFDAPVGLMFTIDRDMELGSWLDYGMFIQSIMLAAREHGLETCPQAAWCTYHETVMSVLGADASQMLVCGMALGYPAANAAINSYRTDRLVVDEFTTFLDE